MDVLLVLFRKMSDQIFNTDELRVINSTNTQLRRLEVISAFVRIIGKRQIPIELLKKQTLIWSFNVENEYPEYVKYNGKLTEKGKPTTAFNKYVSLIKEIGLIQQLGSVITLTTSGRILFHFIKDKNELSFELSTEERLFYLYILFNKDADYILLIIDMIVNNPEYTKQHQMQEDFKQALLLRLHAKSSFASRKTQMSVHEKIRVVSKEWKNAESYSEHIIAPRVEWLIDLGILKKNNGRVQLTDDGILFNMNCPKLQSTSSYSDINEQWLNNCAFSSFNLLFSDLGNTEDLNQLDRQEQVDLIGECLANVLNLFRSGSALRVRLHPSLVYTSIHSFCSKKVFVEFDQIITILKENFVHEGKLYQLKNAARITEGYIMVKIQYQ